MSGTYPWHVKIPLRCRRCLAVGQWAVAVCKAVTSSRGTRFCRVQAMWGLLGSKEEREEEQEEVEVGQVVVPVVHSPAWTPTAGPSELTCGLPPPPQPCLLKYTKKHVRLAIGPLLQPGHQGARARPVEGALGASALHPGDRCVSADSWLDKLRKALWVEGSGRAAGSALAAWACAPATCASERGGGPHQQAAPTLWTPI